MHSDHLWTKLGYAGLIPFVLLAVIYATSDINLGKPTEYIFVCYSAAILSFLAGTLWLREQGRSGVNPTLASNLITLLAFVALLLSYPIGVALLMIGFLLVLWLELSLQLFTDRPVGYKRMRLVLTAVVVGCHFVLLWSYR